MGLSINFDTDKSGWSIVYIEGLQITISKKILYFLSLKIEFVLANSADPDFMWHFIWVFTVCHSTSLGFLDLEGLISCSYDIAQIICNCSDLDNRRIPNPRKVLFAW